MSHYLPECVYAFFEPNPPIAFHASKQRHTSKRPHHSVSQLIPHLIPLPVLQVEPTKQSKDAEAQAAKDEQHAEMLAEERPNYLRDDPPLESAAELTSDPHLTLFVGRLSYKVDEDILRAEFSRFGQIRHVRVVHDAVDASQSRGYAFVEFTNQHDLDAAFHAADGQLIASRPIVVDYERRRTDLSWFPRRLGGGIGETRNVNPFHAPGRYEDAQRALAQKRERERQAQRELEQQQSSRGRFGGGRGGRGRGGGHNSDYKRDQFNNDSRRSSSFRDRGSSRGHRGGRNFGGSRDRDYSNNSSHSYL